MTEGTLTRLLTKWQNILCLTNWQITIEFVGRDKCSDSYGEVDFDLQHEYASIWILRQEERDRPPIRYPFPSIEHTVIHELLHIIINSRLLKDTHDKLQDEEELVMNRIALAFEKLGN